MSSVTTSRSMVSTSTLLTSTKSSTRRDGLTLRVKLLSLGLHSLENARNSIICQRNQNDRLVLLGIPKKRKHESRQKLQRRMTKAKTRIVKMHYDEFLQDPRWKTFRQFVFSVRGRKCERCQSSGNLQVHHIKYKEGLLPWEYTCNDVMVLCRGCHEKIHGIAPNK